MNGEAMATLEMERRDQLLGGLARLIERHGLQTPATWLLAIYEPLGFIGGQMLLLSQPLLAPFVGDAAVRDLALLLEDRENVKRLQDMLER